MEKITFIIEPEILTILARASNAKDVKSAEDLFLRAMKFYAQALDSFAIKRVNHFSDKRNWTSKLSILAYEAAAYSTNVAASLMMSKRPNELFWRFLFYRRTAPNEEECFEAIRAKVNKDGAVWLCSGELAL